MFKHDRREHHLLMTMFYYAKNCFYIAINIHVGLYNLHKAFSISTLSEGYCGEILVFHREGINIQLAISSGVSNICNSVKVY